MEWDAAHFYLRHGQGLVWTEHGQRGSEFRCERNGLHFDVECKRVGRHVDEKTGDRTALGLCYAVARVFDALNLGGEVVLETPLTNEDVVEADVIARIRAVYEQGVNGARMDLGPIGVLSGTIRRRNNHPNPGMLRQLDRHIHSVPAGGRFSAITLPIGSNRPQDHLFLEFAGLGGRMRRCLSTLNAN